MRKSLVGIIVLAAMASGCATAPAKVAAISVGDERFQNLSCPQLRAEEGRIAHDLATTSAAQNRTRAWDAVGLAFVLLPAGSLLGGNHASDIAELKGEQDSAQRRAERLGCSASDTTLATTTR